MTNRFSVTKVAGITMLPLLSACGATVASPPPQASFIPASPPPAATPRPGKIIGSDARTLIASFGQPRLDVRDGPARKLQYTGARCILDVFLYAPAAGREPVVTHADARQITGDDMDPESCARLLMSR